MHADIAVAGLVVGFIIGLTGMGGGALMTPMLVILFNVDPTAAISSDVVASMVLKPIGGGVHLRRGTVNLRLVQWLSIGSVPSVFFGAWLIAQLDVEDGVRTILGVVLLIAAVAMLVKTWIQTRRGIVLEAPMDPKLVRPMPTVLIGALGGFVVGMTSVGSGSLMIVMLMLTYPLLSSKEMVGTDLVQAIPLVTSAALGHLLFGDMQLDLTLSVLVGAIPGVWAGAHVSSRASDRYIRPVLIAVLAISALKLLDAPNAVLLSMTAAFVVAGSITMFVIALRQRRVGQSNVAVNDGVDTDGNADDGSLGTSGGR